MDKFEVLSTLLCLHLGVKRICVQLVPCTMAGIGDGGAPLLIEKWEKGEREKKNITKHNHVWENIM